MEVSMKNVTGKSIVVIVGLLAMGTMLNAQALLNDDTLFIGSATGAAGEQVVLPVYMKTVNNIQGWQIPLNFGYGATPVHCDSVSMVSTVMESWVFKAPFVNNNDWGGVQTCGTAGVVDWMGGSIGSGNHLVMNLFFTVDQSPPAGTYTIDTTSASWSQGGPQNSYVVTVGGSSYITHVVQGEIVVTLVGVEENEDVSVISDLKVYPTVVRCGSQISVQAISSHRIPEQVLVYDAMGCVKSKVYIDAYGQGSIDTRGLSSGVYFIATEELDLSQARKVVIY